ncbi:hypothetical protein [Cohnella cholangitidis]|uniref:hypothetical protein n=1 Tax=Cohnella cholangitidis TaxID=2598458 RepID=UPI0015FE4BA8|nr:hypothetical protein [Cohnella cholangitidis]
MNIFIWPWESTVIIHSPWMAVIALAVAAIFLSVITWARLAVRKRKHKEPPAREVPK